MVLEGRAEASLLDTYEPERIAFARRLVATTDRAFTFVNYDGPIARVVREDIVPRVMPQLLAPVAARRFMFRTISQISIEYRASPLSAGRTGQGAGRRPPALDRQELRGAAVARLAGAHLRARLRALAHRAAGLPVPVGLRRPSIPAWSKARPTSCGPTATSPLPAPTPASSMPTCCDG